jgi:hypothetical protein
MNVEFPRNRRAVRERAWLIHQIVELPLKRRNIVLSVFEIRLECLQLMLLLRVPIVGHRGELRQLRLNLLFPRPAMFKRRPQFTRSMHCTKPSSLVPLLSMSPQLTRTSRNGSIWQGGRTRLRALFGGHSREWQGAAEGATFEVFGYAA